MRHLKLFLLSILIFFLLLSIISWLMPSRMMLVRTVMMAATKQDIEIQIADLRNWKNWNPYFKNMPEDQMLKLDSSMLAWLEKGDSLSMTLRGITGSRVEIELNRQHSYPLNYAITVLQISNSPGWQVEWQVTAKLPWYPWERFAAIFFDKTAGPSYEAVLASLKDFCETNGGSLNRAN